MITDLRLFHLKTGMGDEISQFNRPQHTKEYIFETPLPYTKNGIFDAPYTTKWHFQDPHIQTYGIFETPYTNCILETTHIQKKNILDATYTIGDKILLIFKTT